MAVIRFGGALDEPIVFFLATLVVGAGVHDHRPVLFFMEGHGGFESLVFGARTVASGQGFAQRADFVPGIGRDQLQDCLLSSE